ncbi:MAG: helix-turn-helix domain-containing protein [Clostridia bacterium]|nr:MAG: helix-turn-helix domain-containing protein [Clostridia bacterium]
MPTQEPSLAKVVRAKVLLGYADGVSVSNLARQLRLSSPTVERCLDKALDFERTPWAS